MRTPFTTTDDNIIQSDDLTIPLIFEHQGEEKEEKLQVCAPADLPSGFRLVAALEDGRYFEVLVERALLAFHLHLFYCLL